MYSNSLPVISVPPWSTQKVCQCDVWFQEGEEEIQNRDDLFHCVSLSDPSLTLTAPTDTQQVDLTLGGLC